MGCESLGYAFILRIVTKVVKYLHIIIPILLIVLIIYDLAKTMTGQIDEKQKKDAVNKAAKRMIYALIVFLIPSIITILFDRLAPMTPSGGKSTSTDSKSWMECWNYFYKNK